MQYLLGKQLPRGAIIENLILLNSNTKNGVAE